MFTAGVVLSYYATCFSSHGLSKTQFHIYTSSHDTFFLLTIFNSGGELGNTVLGIRFVKYVRLLLTAISSPLPDTHSTVGWVE